MLCSYQLRMKATTVNPAIMNEREIEQGLRFEAMLGKLGLSMYTDDWACKVLAVAYWLDGKSEAVILSAAFHFAIRCSQQKLNLIEGCTPDPLQLTRLLSFVEELQQDDEMTPWLHEVYERYDLK